MKNKTKIGNSLKLKAKFIKKKIWFTTTTRSINDEKYCIYNLIIRFSPCFIR